MELAIDIRNDIVAVGLRSGEGWAARFELASSRERSAWEYGLLFSGSLAQSGVAASSLAHIAISSVVPSLTDRIALACERTLGHTPLLIGPGVKTGVRVKTEHPVELGSDILCCALAAAEKAKSLGGKPCIVVDLGYVLVVQAVSAMGEILGASIAPGMALAMESLHERSAQLPEVRPSEVKSAIGRNTAEALRSGIVLGWREMVRGMVALFRKELGPEALAFATGTPRDLELAKDWGFDAVYDDLALEGIARIGMMNRQ